MASELDLSNQDVVKLASFLRDHPEAVTLTSEEVASRAGVDVQLVRHLVRAPQIKTGRAPRDRAKPDKSSEPFWTRCNRLLSRAIGRPIRFVAVTTATALGLTLVLAFLLDLPRTSGILPQHVLALALIAFSMAAGLALHLATYYRHGQVRIATLCSLIVGLVVWLALWIALAYGETSALDILLRGLIGFVMAVLVLFAYVPLAISVSILGGYANAKRAEAERRGWTRQDLIARLFTIEETLKSSDGLFAENQSRIKWFSLVRKSPYQWAVKSGLALGVVTMLTMISVGDHPGKAARGTGDLIVLLFNGCLGLIVLTIIGFLAGRPARAIACTTLVQLASIVPLLIPIAGFGPAAVFQNAEALYGNLASLGVAVVVGALSGMGGLIEERANQARRLQQNDPSILIAEMVEIQRNLNSASSTTTVLVVDVAGSTAMKANAEPLRAEYSFREYQRLIARVMVAHDGQIHSTAGDGAVVAFQLASQGLAAACDLMRFIEDFNRDQNRLPTPFRLRIGLHTGEMSGNIDDVEFTQVIDIAAHIEASVPVGSIGVSELCKAQIPGVTGTQLPAPVDGLSVFVLDANQIDYHV